MNRSAMKLGGNAVFAVVVLSGVVALGAAPASAGGYAQGVQTCAGGPSHYAGIKGLWATSQIDFTSTLDGSHIRYIDPSIEEVYRTIYSPYTSAQWSIIAGTWGYGSGTCS